MKKLINLTVLFLAVVPVLTFGQKGQKKAASLDFGPYLGFSNYMGEFTKGSFPLMAETKPAGGLIARYNYGPYLTFKGTAVYGSIAGTDKHFGNDPYRRRRNLNFRSDIVEFSIQAEWNILGYENTRTSFGWSPYLFVGVSVFKFNPKTQFHYIAGLHDATLQAQDGDWIELQPLGTEGQETTKFNDKRRYSLTQISIPLGFGAKWQLDDHWAFGIDFGVRKTFTDYLDDVSSIYVDDIIVGGASGPMAVALKDRSQELGDPAVERFENNDLRGNSKTKDWYMIGGLTLTYRILGGKQPCFNF
jgi:hypothetical protein